MKKRDIVRCCYFCNFHFYHSCVVAVAKIIPKLKVKYLLMRTYLLIDRHSSLRSLYVATTITIHRHQTIAIQPRFKHFNMRLVGVLTGTSIYLQ